MTKEPNYSVDFARRGDRLVAEVSGQTQIRLDEFSLAAGLFHAIPSRAGDLLRIGLAAYAADRLSRRTRRHQSGGSRRIGLKVGVVEPDFWTDEATVALVQGALEFLGGDTWCLRFHARPADPSYLCCEPDERPYLCLYSGGLDSAAGLATQLRDRQGPTLAVSVWHQARQRQRIRNQLHQIRSRYGADLQHVVAKTALFKPPQTAKQEWSQRCRSFLFLALGGAVACDENAEKVEVYESGVGAINLPLMHGMSTGARTTRSSHPFLLRLFGDLVSRVAERRIDYSLPHKNRTKGELVRTLVEDKLSDVAAATDSCVRYLVHGKARHCGYCPACIGRRQAMFVAGVNEPQSAYEYDLFGEPDATNAIERCKLDNLKATLLHVDRLSELRCEPLPEWFRRYALATRVATDLTVLPTWVDVLLRYRAEWLDLIALGQAKGWEWANWLPASCAA